MTRQAPHKDPHTNTPEDELPETDRKSKVPKHPEDTDDAGNALNDVGQDNHHRKHTERDD
jgi:hypothetical protein